MIDKVQSSAKMAKYPFRPKVQAKCQCFETKFLENRVSMKKLDLAKIELLEKNYMELNIHVIFFFFKFLSLIAYNSIFKKLSFSLKLDL